MPPLSFIDVCCENAPERAVADDNAIALVPRMETTAAKPAAALREGTHASSDCHSGMVTRLQSEQIGAMHRTCGRSVSCAPDQSESWRDRRLPTPRHGGPSQTGTRAGSSP